MTRFVASWVDVALDQYLALPVELQLLVDRRVAELLDDPDGLDCSHDVTSDLWTTTDARSAGLIVYAFRPNGPRVVILRLVYG